MKWSKGPPPARIGLYLIQYDSGEIAAAEVQLGYPTNAKPGDGRVPYLYVDGESELMGKSGKFEGYAARFVRRHYGPVRRPPTRGTQLAEKGAK